MTVGEGNPFKHLLRELPGFGQYYSLPALNDPRVAKLPISIRVLLESAIRNCDEFEVKTEHVNKLIDSNREISNGGSVGHKVITEVPFKPARVLLQDFTGVPALVDLTAMRDAMHRLGGKASAINPLVPVELVIDHSVQADFSRSKDSLAKNEEIEFERNYERFAFLKWGSLSFENMVIVPPGSGIVHQVNLEYLARGVFNSNGLLYPDSLVGTDSHTTMIAGVGVAGWGVGGIEAEAVMLGQPISMVIPEVVGFKLTGKLLPTCTATDLVLTITAMLRKKGVVGKFVEFFGVGCCELSVADRATISNMSPEYGATVGYFPMDEQTLTYLRQTGREPREVQLVEEYLKAQGMFRTYTKDPTSNNIQCDDQDTHFTGGVMTLDLGTVEACLSGPKRPHDRVALTDAAADFQSCLSAKVGFKGFGLQPEHIADSANFTYKGKPYSLSHGSVVIAAITSCTNTSNPSVMLGAALLAKKAVERGLTVAPYIKTSLSPGSAAVLKYLELSGLLPYLESLGFHTAGFGCMTCIGNSGELDDEVTEAIKSKDLIAAAVLSGNRNFEGRVHPLTRANYLASPPLVVAYALAGSVTIDVCKNPIGTDQQGKPVYMSELWPSREEIDKVAGECVLPRLFKECYDKIKHGNKRWNDLDVKRTEMYDWSTDSTYIHNPPFFTTTALQPSPIRNISNAYVLLSMGDSITTDHISPAGAISPTSPAGMYLSRHNIKQKDFNSYGSRRGNDEVMARGTFANIRIVNKLASKTGPITLHVPSGEEMSVFDAAEKYNQEGSQLIILAGKEYGSGSSRDWAAKGPMLQGVKAVIAESFERIHRSNLVGMGILPLEFCDGQNADSLGLSGREQFTIRLAKGQADKSNALVTVEVNNGTSFTVRSRIDTEVEVEYYRNNGILNYVLRKLLKSNVNNKTG
eukprot:GHVQ01042354.1.p1 GENE.GHVQ01042354.1~~GHVQ01042354.1.p1  ORF type:complete len:919 (-),score=114.61 GHVQ01042354.1:568-3324(-)